MVPTSHLNRAVGRPWLFFLRFCEVLEGCVFLWVVGDDDGRTTTTTDDDDVRRRRRRTTDDGRRTTDDDDDDDDEQMSKHIFKPCHQIEFNTTNPNPIFKITISFTKTSKKSKYFHVLKHFGTFQKSKVFRNSFFYFLLCIRSIIYIFIFLYIYIFIYLYIYIIN